jgi:23S rRNA (pseudouridine1915-N3)-methyltransferase
MKLTVLAVGQKQPGWVNAGFEEYASRMPSELPLQLIVIKMEKRSASTSVERLLQVETKRLRAALSKRARSVVLDERGEAWSTRDLADRLRDWIEQGRPVSFMVGGPDGIANELKHSADDMFSLSRLTLPHGLARVVLAEQLYRAASLLAGHPYHRE